MNLLDLLIEDNIELKQSGSGRWVARCPFHEGDREPSFTVYPTESYFCFACRAWGDAIIWLINYRKMQPSQAYEYMGADYEIKRRPRVIKVQHLARTYPFLYDVAEVYHKFLLQHQGALSYLEGRGLTMETIKKYKLGYTDGRVLDVKNVFDYELAQQTGILTEKGWERLSHRITIPNLLGGNCDYIMGRTVIHDKIKYLGTGGHKPLQGSWALRSSPIWMLVEGHFDWLLLRQWGYPAVAIGGTHTSKDNISLLRSKKIISIPDNDPEGMIAAKSLQEKIPKMEILDYSEFGVKDIGELALEENGQAKFEQLLREKLPWLITSTSQIISTTYFPSLNSTIPLVSI